MNFRSYITGSRAYGGRYVRNASDLDLVVAVDDSTLDDLLGAAMEDHGSYKLQFGNLNLVAFNIDIPEERDRYWVWKNAHDYLLAHPPKTKEEAIEVFRSYGAEKSPGNY